MFLSGPPSSEKSFFIKMMEIILQSRCVHITLSQLINSFERYEIKKAWFVRVSELEDFIDEKLCGILKAVIGRDGIP